MPASARPARRARRRQHALGRVVMAVERELRKRLGSRFSVDELVGAVPGQADALLRPRDGHDPQDEPLADASAACDAAFYLYMREASDFGGGRSWPPGLGSSVGRPSRGLALARPGPARRIVIASASKVTVTARCPAQCSE